jgi:hypothetical protein
VLRPSGRSGLRLAAGDALRGGARMNVQLKLACANSVPTLFPAPIGCCGIYGRERTHIHLERFPVIGRQFSQCGRTTAERAVEPLFLNWTRIRRELNNRLPAVRAGQGDFVQFHIGFVFHGVDNYNQVAKSSGTRINCSHSWQFRLISSTYALFSLKVPS